MTQDLNVALQSFADELDAIEKTAASIARRVIRRMDDFPLKQVARSSDDVAEAAVRGMTAGRAIPAKVPQMDAPKPVASQVAKPAQDVQVSAPTAQPAVQPVPAQAQPAVTPAPTAGAQVAAKPEPASAPSDPSSRATNAADRHTVSVAALSDKARSWLSRLSPADWQAVTKGA